MSTPVPDPLLFLQHPFTKGDYTIPTPAIRCVYADVEMAVAQRYKCLALEGPPCHGKTTASLAVLQLFSADHSEPAFWFTARRPDEKKNKNPEKPLWANLLASFGYAYSAMDAEKRFNAVLRKVRSACAAAGADRALLIIDEAGELGDAQLVFLKELRNELLNPSLGFPVSLTIVLFGSEKMRSNCDSLLNERELSLYSRFFMRYQQFPGLRKVQELGEVIKVLDDPAALEQPAGSGVCTTQFFFPLAWKNGWRLEKEAPSLWRVMESHFPAHRDMDVGTEAVIEVLKTFLKLYPSQDAPNFVGGDACWTAAVRTSLFTQLVNNVKATS